MNTSISGGPQKDPLLERSRLEMLHSYRTQLKPVKDILYSSVLSLFGDQRYAQSLSDYIVDGIVHNGAGFLAKYRSMYILGLRVLGLDPRLSSINIKHFNRIFILLKELGEKAVKEVKGSEHLIGKPGFVNRPLSKHLIERASLALFILRFPYMVRLPLNSIREKEILNNFIEVITDHGYHENAGPYSVKFDNMAVRLFSKLRIGYEPNSLVVDFSYRTYKGQKTGRLIPVAIGSLTPAYDYYKYSHKGPVAKTTVLSEKAGKTRIIVGYTGVMNSTDLYYRARAALDMIKEDVSSDQGAGHIKMHSFLKCNLDRPHEQMHYILSADLKSFSDNLYPLSYMAILERLGAEDFYRVISSPIYVGDKIVNPTRLLMGLRGTFEVASLAHHAMVLPLGRDYVMCGDDLLLDGTSDHEATLNSYLSTIAGSGLILNQDKTIVSKYVGVFCGRASWMGEELIIPTVPTFTLFDQPMDKYETVRCAGTVINNVQCSSLSSTVKGKIIDVIVKFLGRLKPFKRSPLPKNLPMKIGGLGLRGRKEGLLSILEKRWVRTYAIVPRMREDIKVMQQKRKFIPRDEPSTLRYDFSSLSVDHLGLGLYGKLIRSVGEFTNLLTKGHYQLSVKPTRDKLRPKTIDTVLDILEYYYFDKLIEVK